MARAVLLLALAALALGAFTALADDPATGAAPAVDSTATEASAMRQAAQRENSKAAKAQQAGTFAPKTAPAVAGPAAGPAVAPAASPAGSTTEAKTVPASRGTDFPGVSDTSTDTGPDASSSSGGAAFPGRAPQVEADQTGLLSFRPLNAKGACAI
jgi:hypothetical protein